MILNTVIIARPKATNISDCRLRSFPVESETTTSGTYRSPGVSKPCKERLKNVYIISSCPMETQSVHHASYKPPKPKVNVGSKRISSSTTNDLRRTTVPVENCTTYTTHFGGCNSETISNELQHQGTIAEPPKAHDYSVPPVQYKN